MSHTKGFGEHLMLDLNHCSFQALNSVDHCLALLNELPNRINMTKITQPYVFPYEGLKPEDKGITGMVIIAESHISIHTFPLKSYAFIDIFSCRPFNSEFAAQYCIDWFESKDSKIHSTSRGSNFPQSKIGDELNPELVTAAIAL